MLRPLNDVVIIKLEPEKTTYGSNLIKISQDTVRIGKVVSAGPGRWYIDHDTPKQQNFVPTSVQAGERVCFMSFNMHHQQGKQLSKYFEDDETLIKESDILFVLSEDGPCNIEMVR